MLGPSPSSVMTFVVNWHPCISRASDSPSTARHSSTRTRCSAVMPTAPEHLGIASSKIDAEDGKARAGTFQLNRPGAVIETPCFMHVGTLGAVRGLSAPEVRQAGTQVLLSNTLHMYLRPGLGVLEKFQGRLHQFAAWNGPILTDSGGFQVFSLREKEVSEDGVRFRSTIDGAETFLTPEMSMAVQRGLGSDIRMQFDHVVGWPASESATAVAMRRSLRWAERCLHAHDTDAASFFPIVQGGSFAHLREESARALADLKTPGVAIGGLSVGEPQEEMLRQLDVTVPCLRDVFPRYLMGVGYPSDIVESVRRGVDLFDCVLPTRVGWHGLAFTSTGTLRVPNAENKYSTDPIEMGCGCPACQTYSRAALRHLFRAKDPLAGRLIALHNVYFYQGLVRGLRAAVLEHRLEEYVADFYLRQGRQTLHVRTM